MGNPTLFNEIPISKITKNVHEMDRYKLFNAQCRRENSFTLIMHVKQVRIPLQ